MADYIASAGYHNNMGAHLVNVGFLNGKLHITEALEPFRIPPKECILDINFCSMLA